MDALAGASSDIFANFFRGLSSIVGGLGSMLVISPRLAGITLVAATPLVMAVRGQFVRLAKSARVCLHDTICTNCSATFTGAVVSMHITAQFALVCVFVQQQPLANHTR